MLEVVAQPIFQVRHELWIAPDRTLEALESLASDTPGFECLIKAIEISVAVEKLKVSLADHHVIRRRVVVQLLMPLLQKMSTHLLHVMAVHDIEDFIPNALTFTSSADRCERQTCQRAAGGILSINF